MSKTTLPQKVVVQVWIRCGGRCAYPGCNDALWKDPLTLDQMNRAYLAHIIADSPAGPRGHPTLSTKLKADPANIMLLCDTHHRKVDKEQVAEHPVELLRQFKAEHEERIERLTAMQPNRRTHILLFGTRIGERNGMINYEQARQAILPERYPADERGIRIDLSELELSERDPEFWKQTPKFIDRRLKFYLGETDGPGGIPINHLSIFAIAPIPTLIYFGKQVGDIVSADVYQRHRSTKDWCWQDLKDEDFKYELQCPEGARSAAAEVAVALSLSGTVREEEVRKAMRGKAVPTYTLTLDTPGRDFLRAPEQLELFRNEWCALLTDIRQAHGDGCQIHLFPAVPCSAAVEIGRSLLPKSDPRLVIYDHDITRGGFTPVMEV